MREHAVRRVPRALLACLVLAVTGCAGADVQPPALPLDGASQQQSLQRAVPAVSPPEQPSVALEAPSCIAGAKCKTEALSPKGGKLTLPPLPSLKGNFGYPGNNAPANAEVALIASLTNVFKAPTPKGATIVYFLQATIDASGNFVTFDSGTDKAKLSGSLLNPADTYTVYAYVDGQLVESGSVGQPNAKHELVFDSLFNGATLPTNTTVILELGS
jgi:hypothetical protein